MTTKKINQMLAILFLGFLVSAFTVDSKNESSIKNTEIPQVEQIILKRATIDALLRVEIHASAGLESGSYLRIEVNGELHTTVTLSGTHEITMISVPIGSTVKITIHAYRTNYHPRLIEEEIIVGNDLTVPYSINLVEII